MMQQDIYLAAPAKINLLLEVKGKRPDGYHELETVMHQIDLLDALYMRKAELFSLSCDQPGLPLDGSNLALRAAHLMFERFNLPGGLYLSLDKRIPVGAGLAGGSSDAAAVIKGINCLYDLNLSTETLCQLAAELGSDVPFCVLGGTALARGRGELLEALDQGPVLSLLLCKPDFSLSTAEVFNAFRMDRVDGSPQLPAFLQVWQAADIAGLAGLLCNVLESVSLRRHPEIIEIKELCWQENALGVLMSGSGPTVFAIFDGLAAAQKAGEKIREHGYDIWLARSWRPGKDG